MPLYDFSCSDCKLVFDGASSALAGGGVAPIACPSCGKDAPQVWITAPGVAGDGNLTAEERVASILKFGKDPSSRAELNRLKAERGDLPVGKAEKIADNDSKKKLAPFRMTEDQKRDAIALVNQKRSQGSHDAWRMNYTKDPEVLKAAATAAKELANASR